MDEFIVQRYGDLALFSMGILIFTGIVTWLNNRRDSKPVTKNLVWLTLSASGYCLMNYLSVILSSKGASNLPSLLSIFFNPVCSWLYLRTMRLHFSIEDRLLNWVERIFLFISLASVLSMISQVLVGWNPLIDNEPRVTVNAFLLHVDAVGNPRPLVELLGGLMILGLVLMIVRLWQFVSRLPDQHYYIKVGLTVTMLVSVNDVLLLLPGFVYVAPLSYLSYIVEIIRLTYEHQKRVTLKIHSLEGNVVHLSRVAETGFAIGQICHELRNPLALINSTMNVVELGMKSQRLTDGDLQKHIGRVRKASGRMDQTMTSCLGRLRDDRELPFVPLRLGDLLSEARELALAKLEARDQKPELRIMVHNPDTLIAGHENDLVLSFANMITNAADAVKDMPDAWIEVKQSDASEADACTLLFRDSGRGIDAGVAKRVFDINFSTKDRGEGTGLGLSFVKTVMSRHSGSVSIDTTAANTTFVLRLPVAREPDLRANA